MSLRLIEIRADQDQEIKIRETLDEHQVESTHSLISGDGLLLVRGLLLSSEVEAVLSALDPDKHGGIHQIFLSTLEAAVPRIEREATKSSKVPSEAEEKKRPGVQLAPFVRISHEELSHDVQESSKLNLNFVFLFILSSLVAGIGILKESEAITIGAMVIAPFLGPNVALAFGTTVGDLKMIRETLKTAAVGTLIALGISVAWGYLDPGIHEIEQASFIEYRDLALALTCGFAGVLSLMMGQATSLVGVMVAAALLPPLMRAGLFLGGQLWLAALNAFLIYLANVICLNIAGILSFHLAGIRPKFWWQEKAAQKHRVRALLIWTLLLVLLAVTMYLLQKI